MFSGASFGEFPFGEHVAPAVVAEDPAGFAAFLAEITAPREWLLEIDAFSLASVSAISAAFSDSAFGELGFGDAMAGAAGGVRTLRFSTHGYISHAADAPASTFYEGRLTDPVRVVRSIAGRDGVGGLASVLAEAVLVNVDGALDNLTRDYALDGRKARLLIGRPEDALAAFGVVFRGVTTLVRTGLDTAVLSFSDGIRRLDQPVNATVYAGSGGLEGGADLAGKPKPRGWGNVAHLAPPLVDAASLVYQVNDGAIGDVPAVWDRGVALVKVTGAPAAGQYQVNAALGTFTLGAAPAGTVTCSLLGDASLSGYVNRSGDIILRLLAELGLASDEIDSGSFARLASEASAEVGIWTGAETRSIRDVVDTLLANVGAFGGFSRLGKFTAGVVARAAGAPDASYTGIDILGVTREPLPGALEPAVWRAAVGYQRNYAVQDDLAASVSDAQRTFAAEELRVAANESATILSRHPLARELLGEEGLYAQSADAGTEALRRFDLWSTAPGLYSVELPPAALSLDLGDVVDLTHTRLGLAAGKAGRVIGHEINGTRVVLKVLA